MKKTGLKRHKDETEESFAQRCGVVTKTIFQELRK